MRDVYFWIENLPPILECLFILFAALFWYKRYFALKQAEAFFGFYSRLFLLLDYLYEWLNERGLLEISDSRKGNIYALVYDDCTRSKICPGFSDLNPSQIEQIESLAERIINVLIESNSNVYPRNAKKKEWYKSQHVIFSFCNFICHHSGGFTTNIPCENGQYKHIVKCRELIASILFIQKSIENQRY